MSLLGWLGATPTVSSRSLSPLHKDRPKHTDRTVLGRNKIPTGDQGTLVLGVLGTRSNARVKDLEAQVFAPIMEAWGIPDTLILPAEGDSSHAIQAWAEVKGIPVQLVACDWAKQGRKAGLLRDATIQREATHLVLLQGPRSNALATLAERLARKGRPVVLSERPGLAVISPVAAKSVRKK